MRTYFAVKWLAIAAGLTMSAPAQMMDKNQVPLMRPDEEAAVNRQSLDFNKALAQVVGEAAKSTVRIWGNARRPAILAYGTVVGNGSQVLTKWSEVEGYVDSLQVQADGNQSFTAKVAGVYSDEDLVLLDLETGGQDASVAGLLIPAKFHPSDLKLGRFLTTPQPDGKPAAFGVVSVLERNLRETDQAHLGIMADAEYSGQGVRIGNVQPEYGAAEAGLQAGDVILKIGDRTVSGLLELKNALSRKQPGDTVSVLVETAGKERTLEVMLSNRPVLGQFSGGRLNQMEIMGGPVNNVRDGFSKVVQTDMQIQRNQVGGPVVDLQGHVVGITLARADRTRTYVMGSAAVMDLLKGKFDTPDQARAKLAEKKQLLAKQQQEFLPKIGAAQGKPQDARRMRRHLEDTQRLAERMREEMDALGRP